MTMSLISLSVFAVLAFGLRLFLVDTFGVVFSHLQFVLFFVAAFAYRLYCRRQSDDSY